MIELHKLHLHVKSSTNVKVCQNSMNVKVIELSGIIKLVK